MAWITPLVAAISMPISSLLVIGNAARIRTEVRDQTTDEKRRRE
jgi:Cu2+-exporting ATPase